MDDCGERPMLFDQDAASDDDDIEVVIEDDPPAPEPQPEPEPVEAVYVWVEETWPEFFRGIIRGALRVVLLMVTVLVIFGLICYLTVVVITRQWAW